jgi:hypothetical protein
MVGAGGGEQHRLHRRAERLGRARQDDMAHGFRAGRAARLAGEDGFMPSGAQRRGQPRDLRRLARAFSAFEGDEDAARHANLSPEPDSEGSDGFR